MEDEKSAGARATLEVAALPAEALTVESMQKLIDTAVAEKDAMVAEKDKRIAELEARLAAFEDTPP